ncbi:DUF6207 family protein [Streptomyces sp. ISL-99]|nr:DUF6207 family protein [Streptomyces sp. ISL-99]
MVLDISAGDEATVHAVMADLGKWWATYSISPVHRKTGVPGVRAA